MPDMGVSDLVLGLANAGIVIVFYGIFRTDWILVFP